MIADAAESASHQNIDRCHANPSYNTGKLYTIKGALWVQSCVADNSTSDGRYYLSST